MSEETKLELKDLYTAKGEITTQIEILQAQLQQVNQALGQALNNKQSSNGATPIEA